MCNGAYTASANLTHIAERKLVSNSEDDPCCARAGCLLSPNTYCCACTGNACLFCWSTNNQICGSNTYNGSSYPTCTSDISTMGIPHCIQQCEEWCWATAIGMVIDYYNKQSGVCLRDECVLESQLAKQNCCTSATQCKGDCGVGATWSQIKSISSQNLKKNWIDNVGCLAIPSIHDVLYQGNPVLAGITWPSGSGHLVLIVGFRAFWKGTYGHGFDDFYWQYRVSDSLQQDLQWVNESDMCINYSGQGGKWTNSLYVYGTMNN